MRDEVAKSGDIIDCVGKDRSGNQSRRHILNVDPFQISMAVVNREGRVINKAAAPPVINKGFRYIKAFVALQLCPET